MWAKFEIVCARTICAKKLYVLYGIEIQKEGVEVDEAVHLDRRYTDFLILYNNLCKEFPVLASKILFPKKVLLGNFSFEVVKNRLIGLENFLNIISQHYEVLNSKHLKTFLTGHEEKHAIKLLKAKNFIMAKPLLGKSFKILNKIYTERNPFVILALCRLIACCASDPASLEEASEYSEIALRRFDGVSDIDLLHHYVPLLQMCMDLWGVLGRDKKALELKLSSLKMSGHRVDGYPSLLDSILSVE